MAAFQDDDIGVVFPTRFGTPSGSANERVMLEEVDGAGGIRTRLRAHVDGSVTMLRTHDGMPRFVRDGMTSLLSNRRGFIAQKQTENFGTRFDPYELEVLTSRYQPTYVRYAVQPFDSQYNVDSDDTTHWHDVVSFNGNQVLVNAIGKLPPFANLPDVPTGAIPHLLKTGEDGNQYGRSDERRVFAVGRETVKSWGGENGSFEVLFPITPRAEDKAMVLGPAINHAANTAVLGQLYFTGMSATDVSGGWYFTQRQVSMMLAAPYLIGVHGTADVEMPRAPMEAAGASTGTGDFDETFPATQVMLTASAYLAQDNEYTDTSLGATVVKWIWNGTWSHTIDGYQHANYSRYTYSGTESATVTQSGKSVVYSASNSKIWDARSEYPVYSEQTFPVDGANHVDSITSAMMDVSLDYGSLIWGVNGTIGQSTRGQFSRYIAGGEPSPRVVAERNYQVQDGEFSVVVGSTRLMYVKFEKNYSYGQKADLAPNEDYYDIYIGEESYAGPSGMGQSGRVELNYRVYAPSDQIGVRDFYKQNPTPPPNQLPEVVAEIEQFRTDLRDEFIGQTYYDCETASGIFSRPFGPSSFHHATLNPSVTTTISSLTVETTDFLLFDETNGVYVRVKGHLSGSGTSLNLSVLLEVETRHHTNSITLISRSYTVSTLLPEVDLDDDGLFRGVPSPQIRAMFAPLHQEQGSFRGAHYVTAAEESAGALPFHGFNLVLRLMMYDSFGTINRDNDAQSEINFVPGNLLEMLYAFVFSQEYGVGNIYTDEMSGERYPVLFLDRFGDLSATLFNVPVRVHIRDGAVHDWLDALGHPYIDDTTTELYRT